MPHSIVKPTILLLHHKLIQNLFGNYNLLNAHSSNSKKKTWDTTCNIDININRLISVCYYVSIWIQWPFWMFVQEMTVNQHKIVTCSKKKKKQINCLIPKTSTCVLLSMKNLPERNEHFELYTLFACTTVFI